MVGAVTIAVGAGIGLQSHVAAEGARLTETPSGKMSDNIVALHRMVAMEKLLSKTLEKE